MNIREKESVLFLHDKLQAIVSMEDKLEIKYEFRDSSDTHLVEVRSMKTLTKPWIRLMYEFNEKFIPERVIFILKTAPSSLRVKDPLFIFKSQAKVSKIKFELSFKLGFPGFEKLQVPFGITSKNLVTDKNKWLQFEGFATNMVFEENSTYCFN